MTTTTKKAKRNWLVMRYTQLINDASDDKIELLFESQINHYPEVQKQSFRTILGDHL